MAAKLCVDLRVSALEAAVETEAAINAHQSKELFVKLSKILYRGSNLAGWVIKFKNLSALQFILRQNFPLSGSLDSEKNTALHLAARYGTEKLVELVVENLKGVQGFRFEETNMYGLTAAMFAAKGDEDSDFRALIAAIKQGADPRQALNGKYYAGILAFARRKEKYEINTQTGRLGEDDEKYFPVHNDSNYIF
jgi:hypothetical protein